MTSRYYDSKLGRFTGPDTINPDPISYRGFNRYMYVNNNPLKYKDPSGHIPEEGNQKNTPTNAYILEFVSSNGRYTHLVESSLGRLIGDAGQISLGEPTDLPPGNQLRLQDIIGFDRPSDIVARRVYMQQNLQTDPNSKQAKMFEAMRFAFAGDPVYIQSSRFLEDYEHRHRPDNVPEAAEYDHRYGVSIIEDIHRFRYIYIPNMSTPKTEFTVGRGGSQIKNDMPSNLGHEIGHIFVDKKIREKIKTTGSFLIKSILEENAIIYNMHPYSPLNEHVRRLRGTADFTLAFENQFVRPALNEAAGSNRYKKREYYTLETYNYEATALVMRNLYESIRKKLAQ